MQALRPLVIALALGACGPTYSLTDDIDLTWDFGLTLATFDDTLHTPYVLGTKVTLYVNSSEDNPDLRGWTIESTDPEVFRIDEIVVDDRAESVRGSGIAIGEGKAELIVRDAAGKRVGSGTAEVLAPDAIGLDSHGYLIIGRADEAPVDEARIVENGTATYLVHYFRAGRELHGNGVLSVAPQSGITATPRTTFLFENREWLTVSTTAPKTGALELFAYDRPIGTLPLVVVPESDIAEVVLLTESEADHEDGDLLVALAQSWDDAGRRIFGIEYAWDVDGVQQIAEGDLYRYSFKRGANQMVRAARGGHSDSVMIHSDGGSVGSSNNVGCAAGGGGSVLVGLVVLGLRRRRRA
jgi:hypothetical protein